MARLYRRAGFHLAQNKMTHYGEVDIIAEKAGHRYVIEVKSGRQTITSTMIIALHRKAKSLGARPILRYGRHTRITGEARRIARHYNVILKRY